VEESARTLASSLARHQRAAWHDTSGQTDIVIRCIRSHGGEASRSQILRATRLSSRQLSMVEETLAETGEVRLEQKRTGGREAKVFRLVQES